MSIESLQALREIVAAYNDYGMEIEVITENNSTDFDGIEILIGPVKSRGEDYTVDIYTLGKKGYLFEAVNDKVIVTSGSHDTMHEAVEKFFKDYLGYS